MSNLEVNLSPEVAKRVSSVIDSIIDSRIASRITEKDSTVWGAAAQPEASIRLGWVSSFHDSNNLVPEITHLRDELRSKGIDRIVLCGMGGSSLAPEVIAKVNGKGLVILDSTAPSQVMGALTELDRTAVVVSSKSGSTVETDSQKRAFEKAFADAGINPAERIIIVTDPGSPLEEASRQSGYRIFNADPNVGGRYSALTAFGLVPAGLAGCDIAKLLIDANKVAASLAADSSDNPAIKLAAALAGDQSRDKFLIEADALPGFGDWVEQLVAESTGKENKGILPVALDSGEPELTLKLPDVLKVRYATDADVSFSGDLGAIFLLWEYATAIAGWLLGINPFDQPNVESAKVAARALLDNPDFSKEIDFVSSGIAIKGRALELHGTTLDAAIEALLASVGPQSYLSVHAYLPSNSYPQFSKLRDLFATRLKRPVTFGWGPRFLHSTGQYHKGGPKQGVFLQITQGETEDLAIPGREFSFAQLIQAQASGDAKVLADQGLPVLSLELSNPLQGFDQIVKALQP
jgi:glucose-6-phosphate isomerase